MEALIFQHTTTLGIRSQIYQRSCLNRHIVTVETKFGLIRMKCAEYKGRVLRVKPEFDDCSAAAKRFGLPLEKVVNAAFKAYGKSI